MKRYSTERKEASIQKVMPPSNTAIPTLSAETGIVIPPLLMSVKSRGAISYSNFLGGTPPIAE